VPAASLSVIVPSHGRPAQLQRCLTAAGAQLDRGDELIAVVRRGDTTTSTTVGRFPNAVVSSVVKPGYAAALHAGLRAASCDLVAFLDDDAVPGDRWVEKLKHHFASRPSLGGAGGRIANFEGIRTTNAFFEMGPVAKIGLTGRLRSRLHEIPAYPRIEEVDFLPGSNMCYRRELIHVPLELNRGMAGSMEIEFACQVKAARHQVLYDSEIVVEHYPAPRPEYSREDRAQAAYDASFVYTRIIQRHFSLPRRLISYGWWVLIGSREWPGILMWPYLRRRPGQARLVASFRGRRDALRERPSLPSNSTLSRTAR